MAFLGLSNDRVLFPNRTKSKTSESTFMKLACGGGRHLGASDSALPFKVEISIASGGPSFLLVNPKRFYLGKHDAFPAFKLRWNTSCTNPNWLKARFLTKRSKDQYVKKGWNPLKKHGEVQFKDWATEFFCLSPHLSLK